MDDVVKHGCELLKSKEHNKRVSIKKHQKRYRNTFRRIRKKRSKVRYHKSLKELRYNRNTDDLCSAVEVFDITDMEWAPSCSSTSADLPADVTEWQKQDQIAYWKSRAISLELENRMLHQHLRDVYAKTIEGYSQNNKRTELNSEELQNEPEEGQPAKSGVKKKSDILTDTKRPVSPREPSGKNRSEEMKKIYGGKFQKIMGMETALQLNYEKLLDQLKPSYWPSIPLRLGFD